MVEQTEFASTAKNMKIFGIATIVLGLLAMAAPLVAGASIALLVGLLVLAGGIARMLWALQAESLGKGLLPFAIGLLTVICGIVLVTDPILASGLLAILLIAYFLIDGVVEITAALNLRPLTGWGWLLASGIVSVLLGVMIWQQFPLSGAWAVGVLLGIKLLMVGIIMLTVRAAALANR